MYRKIINQQIMNKVFNPYEKKSLGFEIKDVSNNTREVKVVLAKMNVMDSDRDIIRPGAFSKSLQERGTISSGNRKIAFLRHHDWEHQIGVFKELYEQGDELIAVGKLSTSTQGNDALEDYASGVIKEHSIGFNYVADKIDFISDSKLHELGHFEISELKLWEGSAVTFGANEHTPTLEVTKGNRVDVLARLNERMNLITKELYKGKGSDERFHTLAMQLKVLQGTYNDLIQIEPTKEPFKDTPVIVTPDYNYLKHLKL